MLYTDNNTGVGYLPVKMCFYISISTTVRLRNLNRAMAIFGKEFLLWMRFVKTGGQKT